MKLKHIIMYICYTYTRIYNNIYTLLYVQHMYNDAIYVTAHN